MIKTLYAFFRAKSDIFAMAHRATIGVFATYFLALHNLATILAVKNDAPG